MINVLFICLGNICRSPMAEAVFNDLAQKKGVSAQIKADSAGTAGYHIGKSPDRRTIEVLLKHGIETKHEGRKISVEDFNNFDHLVVMDEQNFEDVYNLYYENQKSIPSARKLFLIRDFDPTVKGVHEVPDPYYENNKAFENVYQQLERSCNALIDYMIEENGIEVPKIEDEN
jgi:protein-tyrosine phosphatase